MELLRRRVLELRRLMLPGACLEGLRFDHERFSEVLGLLLSASLGEHVTYRPGERAFLDELDERVEDMQAYHEGYEAWLTEQGEQLAARNVAIARRALG